MDGLDIAFMEFHESSEKWNYTLRNAVCYDYSQVGLDRKASQCQLLKCTRVSPSSMWNMATMWANR